MAVVSIPHNEPWIVARWAFRMLLERTASALEADDDKYECEAAIALDGLHFDLLPVDQAGRVAEAMKKAAGALRLDLLAGDQSDPRDPEFADYLATLGMLLHDVHE